MAKFKYFYHDHSELNLQYHEITISGTNRKPDGNNYNKILQND
jgi:hypothetical protein